MSFAAEGLLKSVMSFRREKSFENKKTDITPNPAVSFRREKSVEGKKTDTASNPAAPLASPTNSTSGTQSPAPEEADLVEEITLENAALQAERDSNYEKLLAKVTRARTAQRVIDALRDSTDTGNNGPEVAVEALLGTPTDWSTESAEVRNFRKAMSANFDLEWMAFSMLNPGVSMTQAMSKTPARYLMQDLSPERLTALTQGLEDRFKIKLIYEINVTAPKESPYIMCKFLPGWSADFFIDESVRDLNESKGKRLVAQEYILKVCGKADFLYGSDQALINYQYIRSCLVRNIEIRLFLKPCSPSRNSINKKKFVPRYDNNSEEKHEEHTAIKISRCGALAVDSNSRSSVHVPSTVSTWSMDLPVQVTIEELSNISISMDRCKAEKIEIGDDLYVCIVAELVFGGQAVAAPQATSWRLCKAVAGVRVPGPGGKESPATTRVIFGPAVGRLVFPDLLISNAPRELMLCLTLVGVAPEDYADAAKLKPHELLDDSKQENRRKALMNSMMNKLKLNFITSDAEPLPPHFYMGWVNSQIFDHTGVLLTGSRHLSLWSGETRANPIGVVATNCEEDAVACEISCPVFALTVCQPCDTPPIEKQQEMDIFHHDRMMKLSKDIRENRIAQLKQVKYVISQDPLHQLTDVDKVLLWEYRRNLTQKPRALGKLLLSVDWTKPAGVHEAYTLMLHHWKPLEPMDALELLDARFRDSKVREYAVSRLASMPDYELANCVLQLVQVLKYEPYHYSPLARFLLRRSLASPMCIGHSVFWHLKAEMANPQVCERHGLILEEYILRLSFRHELISQNVVVNLLLDVGLIIKNVRKEDRLPTLKEALEKLVLPPCYTLALNPTMEVGQILIEKCKVMDSKKLPLWLVFKNADPLGDPIYIIFKVGDDLRQDLLTLQLISLMDNMWKNAGLDLNMIPYGCVATGDGVGMIEVVLSSDTIANITRRDGGAPAAWTEEPLMNHLRLYNKTRLEVERCMWNFIYSCAGYAVCTYILGIGDRHNDNIMLRQDGTMFHIDFGHFLGNFKSKFGIKRETAPFVFTPMYAYMLGGEGSSVYKHFVELSCEAYNIIRHSSHHLIILFALMLSTGMPELQTAEDIQWLNTVLLLGKTDAEAAVHFREKIKEALENRTTRMNDYIHILAH